jgi:hypothetical protein
MTLAPQSHMVLKNHAEFLEALNLYPKYHSISKESISLRKQQFVISHTIRQAEVPALLDSWVTNTPSVKMLCPQKKN